MSLGSAEDASTDLHAKSLLIWPETGPGGSIAKDRFTRCYRCRRFDDFEALRLPSCKAQDQLRPLADGCLTEDINMRLIYVYGETNFWALAYTDLISDRRISARPNQLGGQASVPLHQPRWDRAQSFLGRLPPNDLPGWRLLTVESPNGKFVVRNGCVKNFGSACTK
jgi:hypothetical protein